MTEPLRSSGAARVPSSRGMALVEVLIAVLLFSIAIITILRIQATAIQASRSSVYRSTAGFLTNQLLGQMWSDSCANLTTYGTGGNTVAIPDLPSGTRQVAVANSTCNPTSATVTITTTWQAPGDATAHSDVTVARLSGN